MVDPYPGLAHIFKRYMESTEVVRVEAISEVYQEIKRTPANVLVVNNLGTPKDTDMIKTVSDLPYNIPVIFCSIPIHPIEAEQPGVSGYLVKPVLRDQLLEAISKLDREVTTLLLIEDETDAQQLFHRMLTSAHRGYRVLRASNGIEGLALLRQHPVDLILLDLMMPEMDGYQFLMEKKSNPEWELIPVIIISARDPKEQPSTSPTLSVLKNGGISVQQVIACIEALGSILSPLHPFAESVSAAEPLE